MFKKNTKHSQPEIFGLFKPLPERMKKKSNNQKNIPSTSLSSAT